MTKQGRPFKECKIEISMNNYNKWRWLPSYSCLSSNTPAVSRFLYIGPFIFHYYTYRGE